MNRSVLIHAGLLVVALIAAYGVWTRENIVPAEETPVLSWRGGVERVIYTTGPELTVEINRQNDEKGTFYWLKVDRLEPAPPPPGKPASQPAAPPEKIHAVKQFKGGKSLDELTKSLANLSAIRVLGKVEPEKLKLFGLEGSKKNLKLVSGTDTREFIVGGNTFGNMDLYIQDKNDNVVYVVRPRLVNDLNYADFRLIDRNLVGFESLEVDRVVIRAGGRSKVLLQQNRRDPAGAYWADEATPEKRKELHHTWMSKVSQLRAMEYIVPEKKPAELNEQMTIDFFIGNRRLDSLKLFKGPAVPPAPGPPPTESGDTFYAQSENTRLLVKVSKPSGEELVRDLPNIFNN